MDSMDGTTMTTGMMMPYLHFTLGDMLFFKGWVPGSKGALAGACIALFILTLIDRWLAALRPMMEARKVKKMRLRAPPFNPAHDVMRGVIHAAQSLLGFVFMLAVMTFQAAYLITLVLGLGIGQMLFGRYGSAAMAH
ncbi:CTR copper uptake transporter [Mycena sanguinolenta]|nr:CTR copper uptake transporter [Mycena sanguinolenta]